MKIEEKVVVPPFSDYSLNRTYIPAKAALKPSMDGQHYRTVLEQFLGQEGYPCIGARTALNSKSYALGIFDKMACWRTDKELASGLHRYLDEITARPSGFLTYVAIFRFDRFDSEKDYESSLWNLLNRLHRLDRQTDNWSPEVSSDPTEKDFSYSFGGRAFYMVGMHPESSRKARRFPYPAIAFNLHSQFEALREKGRYGRFKKVVRDNELSFDGSINPMLSDFGKGLEAPQYSGRQVGKDWVCPFNYSSI